MDWYQYAAQGFGTPSLKGTAIDPILQLRKLSLTEIPQAAESIYYFHYGALPHRRKGDAALERN